MNLRKCILTDNRCYRSGKTITPKGVMVHSTGANNPSLSRYVQPDDGELGNNRYNNDWNSPNVGVCVHGFIGKLKNGKIATYQTLPWNYRGWHCASGKNGSGNNTHISFEICEDDLTDKLYFDKVYKEAVELTAYLCKIYNLNPLDDGVVICHSEGNKRGIASAHGDVMHWFPKHGKNMDIFRQDVELNLKGGNVVTLEQFKNLWEDMREELKNCNPNDWSNEARVWAIKNGIIKGDSLDGFNGNWQDFVTKEQLVTVLYRYNHSFGENKQGNEDKENSFTVEKPETPSVQKPSITEKPIQNAQHKKYMNGHLYEIPFDKIDRIEYVSSGATYGETVSSAAKSVKWNNRSPDIITNAELFNMTTYKPSTSVVDNGKVELLTESFGIAFKNYKTPMFSYKNNVKGEDFLGGYPTLVRNGEIDFTKEPSGLGGERGRTALGIKDNNILGLLVIPEQNGGHDASLKELAQVFIENGYQSAINLDGGGSTSYQTNEFSYEQGRKVAGFVCIWYKNGKGNKLSTNSKNSTMQRDESAKSGVKFKVRSNTGLNLRDGAGKIIKLLPNNSVVSWYGYFTSSYKLSGKWYYVTDGKDSGYVSSIYLVEK